jgi:Flp pilus assembly secretin CpaC
LFSHLSLSRGAMPGTFVRRGALGTALALWATVVPSSLCAQTARELAAADPVTRIDMSSFRSLPLQTPVQISRVTVTNPDIADVVVIGERDVVINGKALGETDVLMFGAGGFRRHYRVSVHTPPDRPQINLSVKVAEVRRDLLAQLGVSAIYRNSGTRAGTSQFRTDAPFTGGAAGGTRDGNVTLPAQAPFTTVLSDFGVNNLLGIIEAEEQRGRARLLAEPNLTAANRDSASFLAGGEVPIPIAQPGQGGQVFVTVQYREFGVRLNFSPEILSDSIVKLRVRPEVSDLDYSNAITLAGFRIPALRTRRVETSVDVPRDRSFIISGLFNDARQRVRTGIPFLMNIPVLGNLFSSTQWQRNESELVVIVTPTVIDPLRPRPQDTIRLQPDSGLPAREAVEPRVVPGSLPPAPRRPAP